MNDGMALLLAFVVTGGICWLSFLLAVLMRRRGAHAVSCLIANLGVTVSSVVIGAVVIVVASAYHPAGESTMLAGEQGLGLFVMWLAAAAVTVVIANVITGIALARM